MKGQCVESVLPYNFLSTDHTERDKSLPASHRVTAVNREQTQEHQTGAIVSRGLIPGRQPPADLCLPRWHREVLANSDWILQPDVTSEQCSIGTGQQRSDM